MLKMVDGTGIIGVDMICPLGVSTPQPPNYDRVELEGVGMLVLPNSLDTPLERLELGGKTEQVQTTGVNAWNPESYIDFGLNENSANSIRFENDVVTYISDKGSYNQIALRIPIGKLQIGDYKVSFGRVTCKRKDTSKTESGTLGAFAFYKDGVLVTRSVTFSVDDPNADYSMTCSGFSAGNNGLLELSVENPMISQISVGTYEPYTGGKPSPSQEYPQEIKNVGKWNEEKQKYEVDVKVTGKNLFDKDSVKKGYEFGSVASDMESPREGWFVSDFISVAEGKVYISGKSTGGGCKLYNKDKLFVKNIQATSGQLTIEEGISYFRLNGETKDLNNIQVELGNVATPYQPYKEQTLTLTSDRPITKWGRLVEQGGEIGWLHQSAVKEYIGDDSVALYDTGFYFKLSDKKIVNGEGYCKELKQYVSREKNPCINFNMTPNIYAYVLNTQAIYGSTVSAIKEYLKSHPLHLAYKTEIPEFVPLPQPEQNAIRTLKTYYPTTVITVDGWELDPDIKATYRKEI